MGGEGQSGLGGRWLSLPLVSRFNATPVGVPAVSHDLVHHSHERAGDSAPSKQPQERRMKLSSCPENQHRMRGTKKRLVLGPSYSRRARG